MLLNSIKSGIISGIKCCWFLIKVIVPVYLFITVLKHTPAMDWLASAFAPLMSAFHLPGEAAVPLITGIALDEYGVIAAIKAVNLTGFAVTVVAVMTLLSHSVIVEAAILKRMGMSITFFVSYRVAASIALGLCLGAIGAVMHLW